VSVALQVVDALSKLGFSFWQVLVLVVAFTFRRELRELMLRIASVKVAGSEITLLQKSEAVVELKSLKSEIQRGDRSEREILGIIDAKIRNRLLVSLANIKRGTTYLWPALVDAKAGSTLAVDIRQVTVDRIGDDLSALRGAGIFDYELKHEGRTVNRLVVPAISEDLLPLVAEVERAY
jgi:hypothetical protein